MKSILLIGLGRFGRHIALKLNALNHQVMAIDHNEERVTALLPFVTNAQIGARKIIARASKEMQEKFLLRNGADEVVYPEKQLAAWTAIRCSSEHILEYIELDDEYAIFEVEIPSDWSGKSILELDIRKKYGINILGVRTNGKLNMNITPNTVLGHGTSVLVLGQEKAVHKCFRI